MVDLSNKSKIQEIYYFWLEHDDETTRQKFNLGLTDLENVLDVISCEQKQPPLDPPI